MGYFVLVGVIIVLVIIFVQRVIHQKCALPAAGQTVTSVHEFPLVALWYNADGKPQYLPEEVEDPIRCVYLNNEGLKIELRSPASHTGIRHVAGCQPVVKIIDSCWVFNRDPLVSVNKRLPTHYDLYIPN